MVLERALDHVFGSGSHVRVLRALHALPEGAAVSGRDLARRAGISHPRASAVLVSLLDLALVSVQRVPRADLYRLNREHALVEPLKRLFDREAALDRQLARHLALALTRMGLPVTEALLFSSTAGADVGVALLCDEDRVQQVEAATPELAAGVRRVFGARLAVLVGAPSLERLTRPGRRERELWLEVQRHGMPILGPEREETT